MKIAVLNKEGQPTGKEVELNADVFGIEPNEHAVYLSVKQFLAALRQGTHKTKERGEIKGSTRKIKRQKGTGTARAGSIKNPLFRGGGRTFGPKPRDYYFKVNKKVQALAYCSALSDKAVNEGLVVLDNFDMEKPKTKEFLTLLGKLGLNEKKTLFVGSNADLNMELSLRNHQKAAFASTEDLHTYDILNAQCLVISEEVLEELNN